MEEKKPAIARQLLKQWQGLNRTLRVLIVVVLAVLIVLIAYLLLSAGQVEYEVLQTGLSPQDAAEATEILGDLAIPYTVEGVSSITIRVPKGTRSQVLLQMQNEGFPTTSSDLYNIYMENAMGMGSTDQDKRILEQFSLEQRIAYYIRQMEKIQDASVVVTMPKESQFAISDKNRPAQASVVLTLQNGASLTDAEAEAVRSLVITSVPGLLAENVTIADTGMRVYPPHGQAGDTNVMQAADQVALKQQHQALISEQVHNFLDPVFGIGNVVVSASVDLDFDRKSSQAVTYSPPGDADNMGIIVSLQQAASRAGVADLAAGTAGFDANGAAPFYPEDLTGDTAPIYDYSQQLNAEVNEVREQIEQAQGKVVGLNVSIMIDADEGLDEELENVRQLVANGLGVAPDYISIMRYAFQINEDYETFLAEQAEAEAAQAEADGMGQRRAILITAGLAALLIILIVVIMGIAARKRRLAYEAQLLAIEEARELEAEQAAALESPSVRELRMGMGDPEDSVAAARLREVQTMAQDKPEVVAQLLRNWLTDDYR